MEKRLILLFALVMLVFVGEVRGQSGVDSTMQTAIDPSDSIARKRLLLDSLERADSIYLAHELHSKQLANMRHYHLTGDTKPEALRLEGMIVPKTGEIMMHFTIKSAAGKLLWNERWKAEGYFDPADNLDDSTKLIRLRHVVHAFFANENFSSIDSIGLANLFTDATPADLQPGSAEIRELEKVSTVVYNVFRSRDYFYGIVWLPSKHKFVRLWKN